MGTKRALETRLSSLAGFSDPQVHLEQYRTPASLAAHLVHLADLQGDLAGRTAVDLGSGTGMLAIAAACRDPDRVVGVEVDTGAIAVARENEQRVDVGAPLHWIRGDATRPPLATDPEATTVLMNPPFGAQAGREGADRAFLAAAADLAGVSYSVHNAGSRDFVEAYAADAGGEVTHAYEAAFEVPRQFAHHERERTELDTEVYRIRWG